MTSLWYFLRPADRLGVVLVRFGTWMSKLGLRLMREERSF